MFTIQRRSLKARVSLTASADHQNGSRTGSIIHLIICMAVSLVLIQPLPCIGGSPASDSYKEALNRIERLRLNKYVTISTIGQSGAGHSIPAITITDPHKPETILKGRLRIMVLAGQHGNEPQPVYAVLNIMDKLTCEHPDYLKNIVIVFVPVVNPDGFLSGKRDNANGVDLNRDWIKLSQPETLAVNRLIKEMRPHVLIDMHQWVNGDDYRPNCVETAGFGHKAESRLAGTLASHAVQATAESSIRLNHTFYREQSEQRMAHRRFSTMGICSLLVETSPDWPASQQRQAYQNLIDSVTTTLCDPPTLMVANDLNMLKVKRGAAQSWIEPPRVERISASWPGLVICWFSLLVTFVLVLFTSGSTRTMQSKQNSICIDQRKPGHVFLMTEAVRSDLRVRARLDLIQRNRCRPTDRPVR